jgi:hypothetical protein
MRYPITMDDVVFVLEFIRNRKQASLGKVEQARRDAFHQRLRQRRVQDYQTIEANVLRDRGLVAERFDSLVSGWLNTGDSSALIAAYRKSYQLHDITKHPGWIKLFNSPKAVAPPLGQPERQVSSFKEEVLRACDLDDARYPERRQTVIWRLIRDTATEGTSSVSIEIGARFAVSL